MVRTVLAGVLVLAMAVCAWGNTYPGRLAVPDLGQFPVTDGTFFDGDPDYVDLRVTTRTAAQMDTLSDADTLAVLRHSFVPPGVPGWINFKVEEKAALIEVDFKFFYHDLSLVTGTSYTAGSWIRYPTWGAVARDAFQYGGWDSVWVYMRGSADDKAELYMWTENFYD